MKLNLELSITSSFDLSHFGENRGQWPHDVGCNNIEVFAFMKHCLKTIFPFCGEEDNAFKVLAAASETPTEILRVAEMLHNHFMGCRIIAVSSYLPEISSPESSSNWKLAQKALNFLVLVIASLRDKFGHPCRNLVLVGGSRYDGMWATIDTEVPDEDENNIDKILVVNRLPDELAVDRLVSRLKDVAEVAKINGVYLAVSLEPGPLYTIGDWKSLTLFCKALQSHSEATNSHIGLNLDISHWAFLTDILMEKILSNPAIINRVIHAQISDHNRGHCADAIPETFHKSNDFIPWLSLLNDLANPSGSVTSRLPFGGYISCEHEAACSTETVRLALEKVRMLLEKLKT